MENRYVYRRIEDDIGNQTLLKEAPHTIITRKLRMTLRESRDIARHSSLTALCVASISGNSGIDVSAANDKMISLLDSSFIKLFPYHKITTENNRSSSKKDYSKYFKYLNELKEKKATEHEDRADVSTVAGTS